MLPSAWGLNSGSRGARSRPAIRLLLVDDHPVVREGLRSLLTSCEGLVIVGEATDGEDCVRQARALAPDIALVDISMPRMNGLTATKILRQENPGIKVLILSAYPESEFANQALRSGARGYLLKTTTPQVMMQAIGTVQAGGIFLTPEIEQKVFSELGSSRPEAAWKRLLTKRELEVVAAIAEGLSNKEIAMRLDVGVRTIETHRERAMRKLNIRRIAGLTTFAVTKGLVGCPPGTDSALRLAESIPPWLPPDRNGTWQAPGLASNARNSNGGSHARLGGTAGGVSPVFSPALEGRTLG
jgi:DNA-binding NarL/FixJ family response regulator